MLLLTFSKSFIIVLKVERENILASSHQHSPPGIHSSSLKILGILQDSLNSLKFEPWGVRSDIGSGSENLELSH
jgi:hypothetical protein